MLLSWARRVDHERGVLYIDTTEARSCCPHDDLAHGRQTNVVTAWCIQGHATPLYITSPPSPPNLSAASLFLADQSRGRASANIVWSMSLMLLDHSGSRV